MPTDETPKTGKLNGRLWGARARDWSDVQEPMTRRVYDAVLQRIGVGAQTNYLDVGCGSGLAAQHYADLSTALRGLMSSGNAIRAAELSSDDAVRKAYTGSLEGFRQPDGSYRIGATFRCLFTRA